MENKRNYDEVTATTKEMRDDILQMLEEDDRKSIHVFIRGFVATLTQDKEADDKIEYAFDHLDEYTQAQEDPAQLDAGDDLADALYIFREAENLLEDLHVRIESYKDIAQTAFCAAHGDLVETKDLRGVLFKLSNDLHDEEMRIGETLENIFTGYRANPAIVAAKRINAEKRHAEMFTGIETGTVA